MTGGEPEISDEWLLATVAAHIEYEQDLELDGGVRHETIAESMGRSTDGVTRDKMYHLWQDGKLYRQPLPTPGRPGTPYSYHLEEPQTVAEQTLGDNA